jgi:hypothetical protein
MEDVMGLFDKLFGHGQSKDERMIEEAPLTLTEKLPCPHGVLSPRWDSVDDMGNEEKVTRYVCEACGEAFSPEEARLLRSTEPERVQQMMEPAQGGSDEPPPDVSPPPSDMR